MAPAANTKLVVSNLHYEITPKDLVVSHLTTSPTLSSLICFTVHLWTDRHARSRATDQGTMIPNSNALSHIAPSGHFCPAHVTIL